MSDIIKELNKTKVGDKVRAQIRHYDPSIGEDDQIVNLMNDEDGWHFLDIDLNRTHEELNWNWNIVDFRLIK